MGEDDDKRRKRRITILGISSLLLVAMVVAVTVGVGSIKDSGKNYARSDINTSMKNIKAICQTTDYKETCEESLSKAAHNVSDPKELVRIGFEVAIQKIQDAAKNTSLWQDLQRDPKTQAPLKDCTELAELAVRDLRRSFEKLGDFDVSRYDEFLADMKIWLSAAMTYQETCLDGFEKIEGSDAGERMRKALATGMQLTSNGLAMVSEISRALSSLNVSSFGGSRRLLSAQEDDFWGFSSNRRLLTTEELPAVGDADKFPSWAEPEERRLLRSKKHKIKANLIVAKDGSGNFTTINEALKVIPTNRKNRYVLYIKEGVYEEKVTIFSNITHLMIVGDGPTKTKITGSLNWHDGTPTYQTATVAVSGDRFIAKDIGFENSAGPQKHQAVALRVSADYAIFYNCQMDGYQDTLYAHIYRQFFRDCVISGTIDFIFGNSAAMFQNCTLVVRRPLPNQRNIVTAHGRKEGREPTGLVFQNCSVVADPLYYPVRFELKSYLARPWKLYSRTVFMESFIDDLIDPEGFLPWAGDFALDTCYYVEYNNRGPGSIKDRRVQWRGIKRSGSHKIQRFTAKKFIEGDSWVKSTKVPYDSGLLYPPPADDFDDSMLPDDQLYAAPAPAPSVETPAPAPAPKKNKRKGRRGGRKHRSPAVPVVEQSPPAPAPVEPLPVPATFAAAAFADAPVVSVSPSVAPAFADAPVSPSAAPAFADAPVVSVSPSAAPAAFQDAPVSSPRAAAPVVSVSPSAAPVVSVSVSPNAAPAKAPVSASPSAAPAKAPVSASPSAAPASFKNAPVPAPSSGVAQAVTDAIASVSASGAAAAAPALETAASLVNSSSIADIAGSLTPDMQQTAASLLNNSSSISDLAGSLTPEMQQSAASLVNGSNMEGLAGLAGSLTPEMQQSAASFVNNSPIDTSTFTPDMQQAASSLLNGASLPSTDAIPSGMMDTFKSFMG